MLFRKNVSILFIVVLTSLFLPSSYANNAANINILFDLAESEYPQYFSPSPALTQTFEQWTFRYYSNSDIYAGVNAEGHVFVVGGYFGDTLVHVGQLDALLNQECSQRMGPYATQTTAWQRWREAQNQRYSVSNGVVPCYESYTRGYCFYVFYQC